MKWVRNPLLALLLCGTATTSLAAWDQSGFPASCHVYQACEGETCVHVSLPVSYGLYLIEDDDALFMAATLDGERVPLGRFDSFEAAQIHVASATDRAFGTVAVPNDEIADAFGMTLSPVSTKGSGETTVGAIRTKLACSAVQGGLY